MTLYQITVYHNNDSPFMPYEDGHRLTATVSLWRDLPTAEPEVLADWAWHVFNVDLDYLESTRRSTDGELAFLAGCVYRLLRLRSLSVGDVVEVATDRDHWWLACEGFIWKQVSPPANRHGEALTAEKVYTQLLANRTSQ